MKEINKLAKEILKEKELATKTCLEQVKQIKEWCKEIRNYSEQIIKFEPNTIVMMDDDQSDWKTNSYIDYVVCYIDDYLRLSITVIGNFVPPVPNIIFENEDSPFNKGLINMIFPLMKIKYEKIMKDRKTKEIKELKKTKK